MNTINSNGVKIQHVVDSNIESILSIWWGEIPEQERKKAAFQLRGPLDLSLMAELEGQLVGFILARLAYQGLPITRVAVIHFIAVKPEYQNQGIGTFVVSGLESRCNTQGIPIMRALIPQQNTKLMKYVEEFGFHPSTIINFDKPCSGKA